MTPRFIKRYKFCGEGIPCALRRSFSTLPIVTRIDMPSLPGSAELYRHDFCLAFGGTARERNYRCDSAPHALFVAVREDAVS